MMIHEWEAKALLARFGAPVPEGVLISRGADAARVIPQIEAEAWVVKAQVLAGGRALGRFQEPGAGPGGGVRRAGSVDAASAAARAMLGRTLITAQTGPAGAEVRKVLVEAAVAVRREVYLALMLDTEAARPVLLVSETGGVAVEEEAGRVCRIPIDPVAGAMPHHGRQVAAALGLSGQAVKDATALVATLFQAMVQSDADLIEINPLAETEAGRLICLDAVMQIDPNALFRQPDAAGRADREGADPRVAAAARHDLTFLPLEGEIGCMVNGAGLAMAMMDLIAQTGGRAANFLDVGGGAPREKVAEALKIIAADDQVRAILVNIFGGIMRCDVVAEGIVAALAETGLTLPLVVRLEGTNMARGREILRRSGYDITIARTLTEAAEGAVSAARLAKAAGGDAPGQAANAQPCEER